MPAHHVIKRYSERSFRGSRRGIKDSDDTSLVWAFKVRPLGERDSRSLTLKPTESFGGASQAWDWEARVCRDGGPWFSQGHPGSYGVSLQA